MINPIYDLYWKLWFLFVAIIHLIGTSEESEREESQDWEWNSSYSGSWESERKTIQALPSSSPPPPESAEQFTTETSSTGPSYGIRPENLQTGIINHQHYDHSNLQCLPFSKIDLLIRNDFTRCFSARRRWGLWNMRWNYWIIRTRPYPNPNKLEMPGTACLKLGIRFTSVFKSTRTPRTIRIGRGEDRDMQAQKPLSSAFVPHSHTSRSRCDIMGTWE